jgi:hypothetical protein
VIHPTTQARRPPPSVGPVAQAHPTQQGITDEHPSQRPKAFPCLTTSEEACARNKELGRAPLPLIVVPSNPAHGDLRIHGGLIALVSNSSAIRARLHPSEATYVLCTAWRGLLARFRGLNIAICLNQPRQPLSPTP